MSSRGEVVGALGALIRLIDNADSLTEVRRGALLDRARTIAGEAERGIVRPVPWTPLVPVAPPARR